MALTKCIAAKMGFRSEHVDNGDGTYHVKSIPFELVPQRIIEMHSLEEDMFLKFREHEQLKQNCPSFPTKDEEHEWLIQHGADFVKQKRIEMQKLIDAAQPAISEAESKWRAAEKAWNEHKDYYHAQGIDPDTLEPYPKAPEPAPVEESTPEPEQTIAEPIIQGDGNAAN